MNKHQDLSNFGFLLINCPKGNQMSGFRECLNIIMSMKITFLSLLAAIVNFFIICDASFASELSVSPPEYSPGQVISGFPAHNYITIAMVIFGAFALTIYSRTISRLSERRENGIDEKSKKDSETNLNQGISVIIVVVATVVMASIGYEKEIFQTSVALFGTIIGFLLGRATKG